MALHENRMLSSVLGIGFAAGLISGAIGGAGIFYASEAGWLEGEFEAIAPSAEIEQEQRGDEAIVDLVNEALPSVVSINITRAPDPRGFEDGFFGDPFFNFPIPSQEDEAPSPTEPERIRVGGGTGFFISSDGMIVTNRHVIEDEEAEYVVVTQDGTEYEATVLSLDPVLDLGILKIEGNGFPALELGDSDAVRVGETVIAIGNALAEFQNTVTKGVVSGKDRRVLAGDLFSSEIIEEAIQTDAAINPGNSGGPLMNLEGEVIGVNTAISDGAQSLGFALPSNSIRRAVESVKRYGRIVRPWIGVRYVQITPEYSRANDLAYEYGAYIVPGEDDGGEGIVANSPAAEAGLREGDIILEMNGQKIDSRHSLAGTIAKYAPGDRIELLIDRQGERMRLSLELEERPSEIR